MTAHTDKEFEAQLQKLKEMILAMGADVEAMISMAMKSLKEHNLSLGQQIFTKEDEVNRFEMDVGDLCIKILALRQPAASDLRFIAIGIRISNDLERMGDLAINIVQRVEKLTHTSIPEVHDKLFTLSEKTQKMVNSVLNAFVDQDVELAQKVLSSDDEVDALNKDIHQTLLTVMQTDSKFIPSAIMLLLISRHLERMADHATNIAEQVIYMVKGQDIRHAGKSTNSLS